MDSFAPKLVITASENLYCMALPLCSTFFRGFCNEPEFVPSAGKAWLSRNTRTHPVARRLARLFVVPGKMVSFLAPHACSSELEKAASAPELVGGTFLKVLTESSLLREPNGLVMRASRGGHASSLFDPQEIHLCTRGCPPRVPCVSLSMVPTA